MTRLSRHLVPVFAGILAAAALVAQTPPATPAPTSPAVAGTGSTPLKLSEAPIVTTLKLPTENPFGAALDTPPLPPPKPVFTEFTIVAPFFGTMRVDRAGRVTQSKRVRDPVPSLTPDTMKSLGRWAFEPARRGGQPAETWAGVRVDLSIEVRPPKLEQITMTPVTSSTPIPAPFEWTSDAVWYDSLKPSVPSDGTVPIEEVDTPPNPKKTPWYADSFRGPFSCRLWVKVSAAGHIEKVIPIQVSDPVLIAYFRHELPLWPVRPARLQGQPVESWNELALSGTVGYSIEVKQIQNLRKTIS
jgi:hypothetical protein